MGNYTTGAQRTNAKHNKIWERSIILKKRELNRNFEVKGICREDLMEYIGEDEATKLSNEEMKNIARLMSDYLQDDYWTCLVEALEKLNIKRK